MDLGPIYSCISNPVLKLLKSFSFQRPLLLGTIHFTIVITHCLLQNVHNFILLTNPKILQKCLREWTQLRCPVQAHSSSSRESTSYKKTRYQHKKQIIITTKTIILTITQCISPCVQPQCCCISSCTVRSLQLMSNSLDDTSVATRTRVLLRWVSKNLIK